MSKKTKTSSVSSPWVEARPLLRDALTDIGQTYEDGGFKVNPYEGDRVTGFSQDSLTGMNNLAGGSPVTQQAQDAFGSFMDDGQRSRAFDQLKQTTMDDAKAALGSTYAGGGLNSGLGMQAFGRGMADAVGGLEYGAYNDAQNRKLSAMGMAPRIQGLGTTDALNQIGVGERREGKAQDFINADMAKYYEGADADYNAISRFSNLSAMMGGLGGSASGTQRTPWSLGQVGQAAGGLGGLMAMFSDRRLKDNIKKSHVTPGGIQLYTFNYKGGSHRHIGPMSDEVPELVVGQINGYDIVDYGGIT